MEGGICVFNCISKTKSVIAMLLVLGLLFIMVPMGNYESESVIINTHTSQNKMIFSPYDVSSTFFFIEKANQFRESHFAETKNKRQLINFDNRIEALQSTTYKGVCVNYGIRVFPFYVMVCVMIIQIVIKYIYNKDGKKRASYFKTNN